MSLQWEAQVVGINYYPPSTHLDILTAAAKDAEEIAIQLFDYGYETFRVQRLPRKQNQKGEWQISLEKEVKTKDLEQAIANLFNPPDGNVPELALFFFSGHGWHKTVNGKEEVFLATSDVFPDEGEYGVSLSWLGEQIQNSLTQKVVVWLDCCYSGALLNYKPTNKDYCLITATRSYEPGIEIAHQQGLFTRTLQKALNPNNYPDGIVDSQNLVKFIQKEMAQTEQAPQCAISERSILLTSKVRKKAFRNECPYRSLNFFTEDAADALVFYGRTKLTQDLVEQVRREKRLIVVFGASGSGKSSLIRAGLLYQLKLGQEIAESNNWVYFEPFTPTDEPLAKLEEIDKVGWVDDKQMVMIIDQFEECFTLSSKEKRNAFINFLTNLMETKPNLSLIIGMRSDFRGRLREYPQFSEKMTKVNVEHLNREEIQEAIEKPAEFVGLAIEGSLKQQLINDVEDYPGSLPLLQYTLTQLWNETRQQGETFLRLATYRDLGGIEGTLEKRADKVYQSLSDEEKTVAKRVFLELTQVGDALDTRRRVRLGDLVNSHHSLEILDRVTNKLADEKNRLITRDEQGSDNSNIIIDVVHEALIRHWTRLGEWKKEYQSAIAIERKIEEAAQEWAEKGKKTDYLLQGSKLAVAEEYQKSYPDLDMLDGMAEEFIEESQKLRDKLEQEEEERKQRELEILEEKRKAEEKARQEAENRVKEQALSNLKLRQRAKILQILSVCTLGIAVGAVYLYWDATQQKTKAQLKEQAYKVQSELTIENNINPLILAIDTVGDNLKFNKNRFNFNKNLLSEVQGSLVDAVNTIRERNILKGHEDGVFSVAISTDGKTIVSGGEDGTVRLWDNSGKAIGKPIKAHQGWVNSVAISTDGQTIVSGGSDWTVRLWEHSGKAIGQSFKGHQYRVNSIAISDNEQTLVSGDENGMVRLWDRSGNSIGKLIKKHKGWVNSVAISRDGQTIVSAGEDGIVRWRDHADKHTGQYTKHEGWVNSVAISRDGQNFVSGGEDRIVHLWNRSGNSIGQFKEHKGRIYSVAISDSGKTIVSGGEYGLVYLWNPSSKFIREPIKAHKGWVNSVAISDNGQTIVSGGSDGKVRLWDGSGKPIGQPFKGHENEVRAVAISRDGKTIISAGKDGTVRLWDRSGKPIGQPFKGHENEVRAVAISADGQTFVSGGSDRTVRLWDNRLWNDLLQEGCDRLRLHSNFTSPPDEYAPKEEEETLKGAIETCLVYGGWDKQQKAEFFVRQGLGLAQKKGDTEGAEAKFKQAKKLNPTINLVQLEAEMKQLAFQAEAERKQPAFQEMIEKGKSKVKEGKVTEALRLYENAQKLDPKFTIDAEAWNELCWFGSLNDYAKDVLFACDKAVKLATDEEKVLWQDSRGVARALTGDEQGAIEDFQVYVSSPHVFEDYKAQRKQWIEALNKGKNPFTKEVLEELKNE